MFAGGADLAAAEMVLSDDALDALDVVDVVAQLVDKSLVVAVTDDHGRVRYRMLESIRQYAQEHLEAGGTAGAVRARHAAHYVVVAETARTGLRSRDQIETAERIARDTDNFRVAIDWAVETEEPDQALRIVAALAVTGMAIGYSALEWAETVIDIPDASDHALFLEVAAWAMWSMVSRRAFEEADALDARIESIERTRGLRERSVCRARATLGFFRGDEQNARGQAETWVTLAREVGDPYELAHTLIMLGVAQAHAGDHEDARHTLEEATAVGRSAAIPSALAIGLASVAILLPIEESDLILERTDEAIEVATRLGDRTTITHSLPIRGGVAAHRGDYMTALAISADAATRMLDAGDFMNTGWTTLLAATALTHLGHSRPTAILDGAGRSAILGEMPDDWYTAMIVEAEALLDSQLDEAHVAGLRDEGARLTPSETLAYLVTRADEIAPR